MVVCARLGPVIHRHIDTRLVTGLNENQRAAYLQDAQDKAISLFEGFEEIERSLIRPGRSEKDPSKEIYNLAAERFSVTKSWHNRVIRSGPNTLMPYTENPLDRIIQADNIFFVDLGPFQSNSDITGETLCDLEYGGENAGHLVGSFSYERIPKEKISLYITYGNNERMSCLNTSGQKRHWILEIHLVDRALQIGGFYEQLLTFS
ncbi:hypothetical protein BGZ57DRAFT_944501 [Hyaloscypha finlandica]|nr:hypothetical protein BGZ57DRAFT_944501 [Hyaloscypha finlandica]